MAPLTVWFIEDSTQVAQDILRYWQSSASLTLTFRHFSRAQAAWEALAKEETLPAAIIVDGHLQQDTVPFCDGAHFVRLVRSQALYQRVALIGFSGDEYALEDMEIAGVETGFYKGDVGDVLRYLNELASA